MGIKNLLYFLSHFPDVIKEIDRNTFYGKKIAVDISILIYQVVIASKNYNYINNNGYIVSHILGLFNKTIFFLDKGIIPIYVFDGKPPKIKEKLVQLRRNNKIKALEKLNNIVNPSEKIKYLKKSVYITKTQLNQCRELLSLMGIPYIDAPEEADSQLSYLCKTNMVYAVLSEDMDILTFGSPIIIRNFISNNKNPIQINLNTILNKLNLSYNQFIELCILFGCDYCYHIKNINPIELYKLYIKTKSIDKTLEELKHLGYYLGDIYDYNTAIEYFINSKHVNTEESMLELHKPNIEELFNLLVHKYNLNKFIINVKLNRLNIYYNNLKTI